MPFGFSSLFKPSSPLFSTGPRVRNFRPTGSFFVTPVDSPPFLTFPNSLFPVLFERVSPFFVLFEKALLPTSSIPGVGSPSLSLPDRCELVFFVSPSYSLSPLPFSRDRSRPTTPFLPQKVSGVHGPILLVRCHTIRI